MLPAGSAQVHYDPVLLDLLPAGTSQVHCDPVLLDLCYLQDLLKSTMICSSRSVLPAGTGCDPVCVKAAPAQRLSSSDH